MVPKSIANIVHQLRCTAEMLESESNRLRVPAEKYTLNEALRALLEVASDETDVSIEMTVASNCDYSGKRKPPAVVWEVAFSGHRPTSRMKETAGTLTDAMNLALTRQKAEPEAAAAIADTQDVLNQTPTVDVLADFSDVPL